MGLWIRKKLSVDFWISFEIATVRGAYISTILRKIFDGMKMKWNEVSFGYNNNHCRIMG